MRTPIGFIFSLICLAVLLASPAVCFADGCPGDSAGSSLESHDDSPIIGKSLSVDAQDVSTPAVVVWSTARPTLRLTAEGPSDLGVVPLRI